MNSRITYSRPNGDWGIEGVKLQELSPKVYGALMKLKRYEDSGLSPDEVSDLLLTVLPEPYQPENKSNASEWKERMIQRFLKGE